MGIFEKEFEELELDSVECANCLRYIAATEFGLNLNMTQVQKLLYMAYGLALTSQHVQLTDERPHAWPFGAIFPNVHKYTDFRYTPKKPDDDIPEEVVNLFRIILKKFGETNPAKLSAWACNRDNRNPWIKARPKFFWQKWGRQMSNTAIYYWFRSMKPKKPATRV